VAHYVFDVGNWDNSSWIVLGGASGDPASPHYIDQHEAWSRCALIQMTYDWNTITTTSPQLTLQPDGSLWPIMQGMIPNA
jgi:penicillin G amidase